MFRLGLRKPFVPVRSAARIPPPEKKKTKFAWRKSGAGWKNTSTVCFRFIQREDARWVAVGIHSGTGCKPRSTARQARFAPWRVRLTAGKYRLTVRRMRLTGREARLTARRVRTTGRQVRLTTREARLTGGKYRSTACGTRLTAREVGWTARRVRTTGRGTRFAVRRRHSKPFGSRLPDGGGRLRPALPHGRGSIPGPFA